MNFCRSISKAHVESVSTTNLCGKASQTPKKCLTRQTSSVRTRQPSPIEEEKIENHDEKGETGEIGQPGPTQRYLT